MGSWAFDDETTAQHLAQISGVHETPTQPAPYIEDFDQQFGLIGSIPRAELSADFQPIVDLASGATCAFEALPRCSADSLRDPAQLFARASLEKTVGELGRTIREIAVRECPGVALHLPVHPGELKDGWLIRPDDPISLHDAEITLLLSQPVVAGLPMQVLKELSGRSGISLALDNFGTGPATLKQLIELEPAFVKLGRELIAGLDRSARKQIAVKRLVAMCRDLGVEVLAKGVDCRDEVDSARACGIRLGQGSVLGEAVALPTISAWPPGE